MTPRIDLVLIPRARLRRKHNVTEPSCSEALRCVNRELREAWVNVVSRWYPTTGKIETFAHRARRRVLRGVLSTQAMPRMATSVSARSFVGSVQKSSQIQQRARRTREHFVKHSVEQASIDPSMLALDTSCSARVGDPSCRPSWPLTDSESTKSLDSDTT